MRVMRQLEMIIYVGLMIYIGICLTMITVRFTHDAIDYKEADSRFYTPYILVRNLTINN